MYVTQGDLEILNVRMDPPAPDDGQVVILFIDCINNRPGFIHVTAVGIGRRVHNVEQSHGSGGLGPGDTETLLFAWNLFHGGTNYQSIDI